MIDLRHSSDYYHLVSLVLFLHSSCTPFDQLSYFIHDHHDCLPPLVRRMISLHYLFRHRYLIIHSYYKLTLKQTILFIKFSLKINNIRVPNESSLKILHKIFSRPIELKEQSKIWLLLKDSSSPQKNLLRGIRHKMVIRQHLRTDASIHARSFI